MDEVPLIDDFAAFGRAARGAGCPSCSSSRVRTVRTARCSRTRWLNPMVKSREYDDLALLGELMLDAAEPLRWFQGEYERRDDIGSRLDADLTPTLLFLAPDGTELAPRIRGVNTGRILRLLPRSCN